MEMATEQLSLRMVKDATASGTGDVDTDVIDTQDWDGCVIFTKIAANAAGNYLELLHGDNNDPTTQVAGSKVLTTSANDVVVLDVVRPTKRYLRGRVKRGTATAVGEIYALRYRGKILPAVNNVENVQAVVRLVSPPSGTP
jgi:hypothetical protein